MKYEENRSQVWFKVLNPLGQSIDQESTHWKLPSGIHKGEWVESTSPIGSMLLRDPKDFILRTNRVFVVEYKGNTTIESPGIIWVKTLRLVREATSLDLRRFGIYRVFKQTI